MKQILSKIALADKEYDLIQENDIIVVGVSGGKDSTLLLYALELYRHKYRKNFKVIGIHVNLGFGEEDFSLIQRFFDDLSIPLYSIESKVSSILHQRLTKDGRIRCSLCSKFKKALVISEGKKHNCNKVAFAHHADDAVETLLLNMIYGGRLACFTPIMPLTETGISFIRPFVYTREKDIIAAHSVNNLPKIKSG
ncbi:MAG: tRNA 2-thiocytidine biosynthesis TtcA family protein, partial [Erysipelotrichaceae bacterium]